MDAATDIKERLNIEDVVAEYVELKRAGRNFKGLSPFTAEKTPSFVVSPEKRIWHDFSTGKGGDVFTIVMEMEGLDFKEALEKLARKAGIDLTQYRGQNSAESGKQKERLYAALEATARFYQIQFSKNTVALEYIFKKRAFTKETALAFRIGYSPNNGTALVDFLKGKGFSVDEIKKAGLSSQRYSGAGDMFRGRVMIPLMDAGGQVIGFTARLLADEPSAPKYINTPQTILYDKSRHVYGLHLAKEAIRTNKYAVLVEGNMDVIASHQVGVKQVVATAGTALTEPHLKVLSRLATDIRLCFDADRAGIEATERAIPIASKAGVDLSMINMAEDKDPDELIRRDPKLWEKAVGTKQYALDWLIERHQTSLDLTSAEGKRRFSDILLAVIRKLDDQVEQDHYITKIAELTSVSADALRRKLTATTDAHQPRRRITTPAKSPPTDSQRAERLKSQNHLLAICLLRADMRPFLKPLKPYMLDNPESQILLTYLQQHPDPNNVTELQVHADYAKILALQFEELYTGLETLELHNEAARLQTKIIEQYVKTKKSELADSMRRGDDAEQPTLLQQAKELDSLLKEASRAR